MKRGLRPFPTPSLESFSQKAIEKMTGEIEGILDDNRILDEKANWRITQALLAASFRRAETAGEKSKIIRQINRHQDEGHRLGFSETEIRAINRVVLQKDLTGQLESFAQKLSERRERQ